MQVGMMAAASVYCIKHHKYALHYRAQPVLSRMALRPPGCPSLQPPGGSHDQQSHPHL